MKYYIAGFLLAFVCFGIGYKYRLVIEEREIDKYGIVYPAQNMPMPEEYRMLTGYDSIEYSTFLGKVKVNFCFPNEWEFRDFKNRSDSDILVGTYPDTIMEARVIKPKKKKKKYGNIAIGSDYLLSNTTGSGMFMYHGENNPLNDSLCKVEGHVYEVPWYDLNRKDPCACYRCKKHLDEWPSWNTYRDEYDDVIWDTATSLNGCWIINGTKNGFIPYTSDTTDYTLPAFPKPATMEIRHPTPTFRNDTNMVIGSGSGNHNGTSNFRYGWSMSRNEWEVCVNACCGQCSIHLGHQSDTTKRH